MTTIELVANDQLLQVTVNPNISSGEVNTIKVHVDFSDEWNNFGKNAVFYTSYNSRDIYEIVMTNNECIIPSEVMTKSGILYIGIRGVNSEKNEVKTTSLVKLKISEGTPTGNSTEVDPTPDVYQQLLSAYGKTDNSINKEISDRKSAISTEKAERQSDIANEKAERQAEIAVERARIDNLSTLTEGSTTADSELLDIRVKADASIATSAGNAVREQISELKEDLVNISDSIEKPIIAYGIGRYDAENKTKVGTQKDRVYTSLIKCDRNLRVVAPSGYKYVFYLYDGGGTLTNSYDGSWFSVNEINNIGGYFALVFCDATNSSRELNDTDIALISSNLMIRNLNDELKANCKKQSIFVLDNQLADCIVDINLYNDLLVALNCPYSDNGIAELTKLQITQNSNGLYTVKFIVYSVRSDGTVSTMLCSYDDANYKYGSGTHTLPLTRDNLGEIYGFVTIDFDKFIEMYGYDNISNTDFLREDYRISPKRIFDRTYKLSPTEYFKRVERYSVPIVSFIDDDGTNGFQNLASVFNEKGQKCSFAIITDKVGTSGYMNLDTILSYKEQGFDVVSHSASHDVNIYGANRGTGSYCNMALVTDETIRTDMKRSRDYLIKYGFNADAIVFPWGHYAQEYDVDMNNPDPSDNKVCGAENQKTRYAEIAKSVGFRYGANSIGGISGLHDNPMWMPREEISEEKGLDYYKNLIDITYENGYWLIFMTHAYGELSTYPAFIGQIIDYVVSKGIEIKTFKDGFERKRPKVSIGEYGGLDALYINADGTINKYTK